MAQLKEEIYRVGASTNFDGRKLLWDGKEIKDNTTVGEGKPEIKADTVQDKWWAAAKGAGGAGNGGIMQFQVGANGASRVDDIDVQLADLAGILKTAGLKAYSRDGKPAAAGGGGGSTPVLTTHALFQTEIGSIDKAIAAVSKLRSDFGSVQNRFEHTINNLNVAVENLSASESRIRDTDMAEEMMAFTRSQILQQAGTSMLAQANQVPQTVLSLLR